MSNLPPISFEPVDFTPVMEKYSGQGAFRFWCQTVLPLVYDDSLSYYELLNKVVVYLNNTIADVSKAEGNIENLNTSFGLLQNEYNLKTFETINRVNLLLTEFTTLKNYVDNYFDNLDTQAEIEAILDNWVTSGEFSDLLYPVVQPMVPPMVATEVSSWLNANVDPVGSAVVVDNTLTISGAAADAKVTGDRLTLDEEKISGGQSSIAESVKNTFKATTNADGYIFVPGEYYYHNVTVGGETVKQVEYKYSKNFVCTIIPMTEPVEFECDVYGGGGETRSYFYCDENMIAIQVGSANNHLTGKHTPPSGTKFVALTNRLASSTSGYYAIVGQPIEEAFSDYVADTAEDLQALSETDDILLERINNIESNLGTVEGPFIRPNYQDNHYWDNTTDVAVLTKYNLYIASDPVEVNPGEKYIVRGRQGTSVKADLVLIVDENYNILKNYRGTLQEVDNTEIEIPANGKYLLITSTGSVPGRYRTVELAPASNIGSFNFKNKNIAIIGDSISTNGNWSESNPLGNVPEIIITEEDVGVQLSAYVTYYDVGNTVGGHTFTTAEIGTEVTFTPVAGDVGKTVGNPANYNGASVRTWWEVAQDTLKFNAIPVCWSGASITSHQDDSDSYKTSYAWHPAQIRKCGIRTPGTMDRTPPDMIIIYRGTNDFSHLPYAKLTSGYFDRYMQGYPASDYVENSGDSYYGYCEGLTKTVGALRNAYPNAIIVLCTLNTFKRIVYNNFPTRNGLTSDDAGLATLPMYNNAIRAAANYLGCPVIEFDKDGITFENCYTGGYITDNETHPVHPSDKGQRVMGNKAVRDLMNINSIE